MNASDVKTIVIYFEESEETTKLGSERMLYQTVMLFSQCKKNLAERIDMSNVTLSFMMLHYGSNSKFYDNKSTIVNFMDYWQKLSDWAKSENTTVILNNAIDVERRFIERDQYLREVGWWKYQDVDLDVRIPSSRNAFIDKIEYINWRFPKENVIKMETHYQILTLVLPLVIAGAFGIIALIFWRREYGDNILTETEVNDFLEGRRHNIRSKGGTMTDTIFSKKYAKDRYEIDSKEFTIFDEILGSGEYGAVRLAQIRKVGGCGKKVAVKMVNPNNVKKGAVKGILSEIKVLSHVGQHENIIEMLRANTQNMRVGRVYIFLELCELGSLDKYLRKMRPAETEDSSFSDTEDEEVALGETSGYVSLESVVETSLSEVLYQWSREICNGMAYLAHKQVVHADLATRNVLLTQDKKVKICDFGLSRRLYDYQFYTKKNKDPMPWQWMSPESLKFRKFNEKSDIWAYGITLWEIYTLGEEPFAGLSWNVDFVNRLRNGMRLTEPKYNDEKDMFSIMKQCWHINPDRRPTFATVLKNF